MPHAAEMIRSHPGDTGLDPDLLAAAIEATTDCAQVCTACADACLGEEDVAAMRRCIQTDLNCADVCTTTSRVLSRQTEYDATVTRAVLEACVAVCRVCADECRSHAEMGMDHCRTCAETCQRCAEACQAVLDAMAG